MSTIIRASEAADGASRVAFNFDDLAVQAQAYLDKVRAEAAAIVAQAKREAAAVRAQAEQQGREAAWQKVEEIVRKQLATALPALGSVIEEIGHAKQAWLVHWEKSGIHLAAAIAERILRRELTHHPDLPLDLLREALELTAGSDRLRIYLNPADFEQIGPRTEPLLKALAPLAEATVLADEQITPGGCRIETELGTIDQRIEAQLQRIEEELT